MDFAGEWVVVRMSRKPLIKPIARVSGNALMEYVVPATVILLTAGVLMTLTDANEILAEYFLSASGRTTSSLQGTTLQTTGLGENSYGDVANGMSGFTSFATSSAGAGTAGGTFYYGNVTRSGGRRTSTDPDYAYP